MPTLDHECTHWGPVILPPSHEETSRTNRLKPEGLRNSHNCSDNNDSYYTQNNIYNCCLCPITKDAFLIGMKEQGRVIWSHKEKRSWAGTVPSVKQDTAALA